jgi:2-iminobutanoate/2-iminopropanoate deaminase
MSEKKVVRTESAPAPFQGAPYSQAISAGGLVFVSGQLGLAPGETTLEGKGIEAQTRQVLENLKAILEEAGSRLDLLLKTTVFLADLADFRTMNAIYSEFVREMPPARATVQVGALPSGALVEIDAVALAG